jgi:hypothetical protein
MEAMDHHVNIEHMIVTIPMIVIVEVDQSRGIITIVHMIGLDLVRIFDPRRVVALRDEWGVIIVLGIIIMDPMIMIITTIIITSYSNNKDDVEDMQMISVDVVDTPHPSTVMGGTPPPKVSAKISERDVRDPCPLSHHHHVNVVI